MSADNFIAIVKGRDGQFRGYNCSASMEYNKTSDYRKIGSLNFITRTVEDAILKAQDVFPCEYGFNFVNLAQLSQD